MSQYLDFDEQIEEQVIVRLAVGECSICGKLARLGLTGMPLRAHLKSPEHIKFTAPVRSIDWDEMDIEYE